MGSQADHCCEEQTWPPRSRCVITYHHCRSHNIDLISLHCSDRPLLIAFGECEDSLQVPGDSCPLHSHYELVRVRACVCAACRMRAMCHSARRPPDEAIISCRPQGPLVKLASIFSLFLILFTCFAILFLVFCSLNDCQLFAKGKLKKKDAKCQNDE